VRRIIHVIDREQIQILVYLTARATAIPTRLAPGSNDSSFWMAVLTTMQLLQPRSDVIAPSIGMASSLRVVYCIIFGDGSQQKAALMPARQRQDVTQRDINQTETEYPACYLQNTSVCESGSTTVTTGQRDGIAHHTLVVSKQTRRSVTSTRRGPLDSTLHNRAFQRSSPPRAFPDTIHSLSTTSAPRGRTSSLG
jgi:hypothetical protein